MSMRSGRHRFTELEAERTQINERLAALARATTPGNDASLLDVLPALAEDIISDPPGRREALLFQAFGLELIYNKEDHQVTIYATITPRTPAALAAIIAMSEPPVAPATTAGLVLSPQHPRCC